MRILMLVLVVLSVSMPSALSAGEAADARAKLDRRGIEFTERTFLDSAKADNWEVVWLFVLAGMSVNAKDDILGVTVLHFAAGGGSLAMVTFLIMRGADVRARDDFGQTVLHWAASGGHVDIVKVLVGAGADVRATTNRGSTVLHSAASGDSLAMVKFLVEEHGLDVNATDEGGKTVLHGAAQYGGHLSVVRYLVKRGADVTARNNRGRTPRGLATAWEGRTEVVDYLGSVAKREEHISIPSSGVGKWDFEQELDPVNDKPNVFAVLPSEDFVHGRSGAVLAIRCEGGEVFDVQILPQGVTVAHGSDTVLWRFDKRKAVSRKWLVSKDRETLFPMSSYSRELAEVRVQQIRWAQQLLVHSKLFVRIKPSDGKRGTGDFLFDLRGSAKVGDLVLGACGW